MLLLAKLEGELMTVGIMDGLRGGSVNGDGWVAQEVFCSGGQRWCRLLKESLERAEDLVTSVMHGWNEHGEGAHAVLESWPM